MNGELEPLGAEEQRIVAAAGADFFSAALEASERSNGDLKLLTQRLKEQTGRKGPELFMPLRVALTGQRARTRTRAAPEADVSGDGTARLKISCSKSIIP